MHKNNFLTFLFGLIPGAGQMYLGSMKKGLHIMVAFGLVATLTNLLPLHLIDFVLPVIWFYSFFDTLTISRLTPEERILDEDDFLHKVKGFLEQDWHTFLTKHSVVIGIVVILLGVYTLLSRFILPILYRFDSYFGWFNGFFYNIPSILFGVILLAGGIYLLRYFKSNEE